MEIDSYYIDSIVSALIDEVILEQVCHYYYYYYNCNYYEISPSTFPLLDNCLINNSF